MISEGKRGRETISEGERRGESNLCSVREGGKVLSLFWLA